MSVYNIFLEQDIIQEQHHNYIFFLNTNRIEFPLHEMKIICHKLITHVSNKL